MDYRLVFLFLTVPYLIEKKNMTNFIFIACLLVSSYSFYFESGDRLSMIYAIKAIIVYGAKLIIFIILNYELGKLYKNFFQNLIFKKNL